MYLGIADDIEVFLRHVFLSQTAVRLHQYEIDHLNITVLQPSMPKLPLNLGEGGKEDAHRKSEGGRSKEIKEQEARMATDQCVKRSREGGG